MSWFSALKHFLIRTGRRHEAEQELDEEIRGYFDVLIERGMQRGLSRAEAERAARVEFDGPEQVKEKVREARMGAVVETFVQDLRYAIRVLRRNPGFTFFAVVTIALALGANAAIFSLVDGVLLKSTGYPEPELLLFLSRNGISVTEVPVEMRPRLAGVTSLTAPRTSAAMARLVLLLVVVPLRASVSDRDD